MTGDTTVFGLVMGTYVIEDIQMDVPHGIAVTIPADKALRSKDLWRGISQRKIFRLGSPSASFNVAPPSVEQMEALRSENQLLRDFLTQQAVEYRQALASQEVKMERILTLLAQGSNRGLSQEAKHTEAVGGEAPMFIPSKIRPDDVELHMVAQEETSESNLADASEALRRLRQNQ